MAKSKSNNLQNVLAATILIIAGFTYIGFSYFNQIYKNPQTVFWGMINQNLQTASYQKTSKTDYGQQQYVQETTMQFKANLVSDSVVTISEKTENNKSSKVITQAIGTTKADFIRYKEITREGKTENPNIINVWAINTKEVSGQEPGLLTDALLSTPLMFGYLNSANRQQLVNQLKSTNAFSIDFNKTDKNYNYQNSRFYAYDVTINMKQYLQAYKLYLNKIGQNMLAENLGSDLTDSSYQAKVIVNPVSYQPVALIAGSGQDEFSNFDINNQIVAPNNIKKTFEELKSELL